MIDHLKRLTVVALALFALTVVAQPASAAIWSNTELHLQFGTLDLPYTGGLDSSTTIFTLQHASGWKYGDNFFFFDVIQQDNNYETYGEWYSYFSFRKMAGKEEMKGALKDVRFIAGFNWAPDVEVHKYLPGIGLSWNVPGFAFLNTDFTLYIDDSLGPLAEDDGWMIDVNWMRPFGDGKWSIEGHAEYISERENAFGPVEAWILAQPQLRYFVSDNVAIGVEYQYWMNKLGDPDTDENTVQALLVWKF